VTSIERTAYPRFKRFLSARELHVFYTPQPEEITWARGQARSDEHLLALMVQAKCFGRLGYFPRLKDVPDVVVGHIRRDLGLGEDVRAVYDSDRTRGAHRTLIRRRSEVVSDMPAARSVAAAAIGEAARRKNDPADLINVALEKLVEGSFELPGYSTLDEMAARIREEVNSSIFATVADRIGPVGATRLDQTLQTSGPGTKSAFNRLKKTAPRPSWTNFRQQIDQVRWVDSLGDSRAWWRGVALSKIIDFAGEGASGNAAVLGDYGTAKRTAVLAAMVYAAQEKARDDTAEMSGRCSSTWTRRGRPLRSRRRRWRWRGRRSGTRAGSMRSSPVSTWNRAIRDRGHPGMFVRRHLEACVLTYLAEELRTGDIAVVGAAAYADWADQLLSPAEAAERLPAFCAGVGIPGAPPPAFGPTCKPG
jgi:hypothetical protein